VLSAGPSRTPAAALESAPNRGTRPNMLLAAAAVTVAPVPASTHEPTLIGEVSLNIRIMFRNRAGRPRSEISSAGLISTPASDALHADRASRSFDASCAPSPSVADAPASPPTKK